MRRKHTKLAAFGICAMLALSPVTAFADTSEPAEESAAVSLEEAVAEENTPVLKESGAYYASEEHGPQEGEKDGTLRLTFACAGKEIDGADITITKVMDVNLDLGRFYPIGGLAEIYGEEIDMEDLPSVGQLSVAKEISGSSSKPKAIETQTTDAKGVVTFKKLKSGMYLVEQTGKKGTAEDYNTFEPFLISIPAQLEDGSYVYEVDCLPKTGTATIPDSTSETPPVPTLGMEFSSLTGLPMIFVGGALSILAITGMATGTAALNKKRQK